MKTFVGSLALAAALLGASAITPANAVPMVDIALQEAGVNGGAITPVNPGGAFADNFIGTYGSFTFNNINGSTTPPSTLDFATSINTASVGPGGTITVYVTAYNLSSGLGYPAGSVDLFSSAFQGLTVPSGWSISEATYISNTNTPFDLSAILAATAGHGSPFLIPADTTPPTFAADPFGVTDVFTITAPATGVLQTASTSISLTGTPTGNNQGVPGPIAGAGVPGAIMACGALLAWYRRRREQQVA